MILTVLVPVWAGVGLSETLPPPAVQQAVEQTRDEPLAERIDAISRSLLGVDYVLDPNGEGEGIDPDPAVRYDAFDCLTYVEEVLALSLGSDPRHAAEIRQALRYDGPSSYATRKHFMELQWIPGALRDGWVVDTTADYGRPVQRLERQVDADTWRAWKGRQSFALSDDQLPVGTMALTVLSLDDAIAIADSIRPGTLLLTVRADRPWKPIWTSHLGIVVPGDVPTVRHATKMGEGLVRDHGLVWYLEHLKTYKNWPAVGVSLLEPQDFGPRRSRLAD